jgi:hypothetical protein
MSDASISVSYTITSITNAPNGLSTVVWGMSESTTSLAESRLGDKFKTSELASGVETADTGAQKTQKIKANFERVALPYFKAFAERVRFTQDQTFAELFDDETGEVEGSGTVPKNLQKSTNF